MKAKCCTICGGDPIFVEYAVPQYKEPDLWEETEEGLEPIILLKQIECKAHFFDDLMSNLIA